MRGIRETLGLLLVAGLAIPAANAGVLGTIWVEVDNSVATMGDAAGLPTGLDGVRTFDLFAIVTPRTKVYAADFGFVAASSAHRPMFTTQELYQSDLGGDTQSLMAGALRVSEFAALEFDTYLGLGMVDTTIVQNTSILAADWNKSRFKAAWYVVPPSSGVISPAQADESGRLFLARISVHAYGSFGEYPVPGHLGGAFFLSGVAPDGDFGRLDERSGLFRTRDAFDGPIPFYFGSFDGDVIAPPVDRPDTGSGNADEPDEQEEWTPIEALVGDLDFDGAVDGQDLTLLMSAYGTMNPVYDLTGDVLIEERDIQKMMLLIDGSIDEEHAIPTTPKELKKAQKRYRKLFKKAEKQVVKEAKQFDRELKKAAKRAEKSRKKREKQERNGG